MACRPEQMFKGRFDGAGRGALEPTGPRGDGLGHRDGSKRLYIGRILDVAVVDARDGIPDARGTRINHTAIQRLRLRQERIALDRAEHRRRQRSELAIICMHGRHQRIGLVTLARIHRRERGHLIDRQVASAHAARIDALGHIETRIMESQTRDKRSRIVALGEQGVGNGQVRSGTVAHEHGAGRRDLDLTAVDDAPDRARHVV